MGDSPPVSQPVRRVCGGLIVSRGVVRGNLTAASPPIEQAVEYVEAIIRLSGICHVPRPARP